MPALRRGIRHLRHTPISEIEQWLDSERQLVCDITEKTDGMAFAVGVEDGRVYTRTAHSPKTFDAQEYYERALKRFGDNVNPAISQTFIESHKLLTQNLGIVRFLKSLPTDGEITGEMFLNSAGEIAGDRIKFVGTWYQLSKLGSKGTFVIHTRSSEIVPDFAVMWSDKSLKVDTDRIIGIPDRPKVTATTPPAIEEQVRDWLWSIPGRWGDDVEGFVLHNDSRPPIKVMNPQFYVNKRSF